MVLKIVRGKKNAGNCMESSKHDWKLSGTATFLHFFFLKSFSLSFIVVRCLTAIGTVQSVYKVIYRKYKDVAW